MGWLFDSPQRWFRPGRAHGPRDGMRQERERLNHDQYTVAATLGGRLIPQRRLGGWNVGGWDVPDVELRRSGLTVRTGVGYHGEPDEARLLRWVRIAPPATMQWRVSRLNSRGRRDLPPAVHELVRRLERDVAGVDLDRTALVVWLPSAEPDPAAVRTAIDRTVSVARKLLVPAG
jgi:hypothetical protein